MRRIVLFFLAFSMLVSCEKKDEPLPHIPAFSETIASSPSYGDQPYYGMSSTWNGRYITKMVRYGNDVYTYVLDNDVGADELGIVRLFKKSGNQSWEQGEATIRTSSNPTLLMDDTGNLHIISHISESAEYADKGGLKHFWTLTAGNLDTLDSEWIVDPGTPALESYTNRRINASIGSGNKIVVSCGVFEQQVNTFMKINNDWTLSVTGSGLDYNYLYPLLLNEGYGRICLAAEQETPRESLIYFEYDGSGWSGMQMISDHTGEQGDGCQIAELQDIFTRNGEAYLIIRDGCDRDNYFLLKTGADGFERQQIEIGDHYISFMRSTLAGGELYLIMLSEGNLLGKKFGGNKIYRFDVDNISGSPHISIAAVRSHASGSEEYTDIVMHPAMPESYPDANGVYVRIDKSDLLNME